MKRICGKAKREPETISRGRTMVRRKVINKAMAIFTGIMMFNSSLFAAGPSIPGFYGKITTPLPTVFPNAVPQMRIGAIPQGLDLTKGNGTGYETAVVNGQTNATVYQNADKAIIDWRTFNVGRDASIYFRQVQWNEQTKKYEKQTSWVALNRIWDNSPSQIFGKLTADGKVYLINQNGILFWPGSQLNVHTLVASSLNMTNSDLMDNILRFKAENYNKDYLDSLGLANHFSYNSSYLGPGVVSNHGAIATDTYGSVFLIGPQVENNGTIFAPLGQIGLIAANTEAKMLYDPSEDTTRTFPVVLVTDPGEASNYEKGTMIADAGLVGMYGRLVNQEGLIRSISAIRKAGSIELHATEQVSTGSKSITYSPVSDSTEAYDKSFAFQGGTVDVGGFLEPEYELGLLKGFKQTATSRIELRGSIAAESGIIRLAATDRVYLESGSVVDVSGKWVRQSATGNLSEAKLGSVEMRDDFGQKEGILKAYTIEFDKLYGSAIGDVSGSLTAEKVTALEQATKGGHITVEVAQGDVIVKDGARILFSGGGFMYEGGQIDTTKLLSGTTVYDISTAPEWLTYSAVVNLQQKVHKRYGVTETYRGLYAGGANPIIMHRGAYTEGSDAGSLTVVGRRVVLDGTLDGSVTKGLFQTSLLEDINKSGNKNSKGTEEPRGGKVVLGVKLTEAGGDDSAFLQRDSILEEVIIKPDVTPLTAAFEPDDSLSGELGLKSESPGASILSARKLSEAGLGSLEISANLSLTIEKGAEITVPSRRFLDSSSSTDVAALAGGNFYAAARSIEHDGTILVPSGDITLHLKDNYTSVPSASDSFEPLSQRIFLGSGSTLSTAGNRIDNSKGTSNVGGQTRTGGGTITVADLNLYGTGEGVIVSKGAVLDVSGGYQIDRQGKVSGGDAGSLTISGPAVILEGTVSGLSLEGNKGGTLVLGARNVSVAVDAEPLGLSSDSVLPDWRRGKLLLGQNQLKNTGFSSITIQADYNSIVEDNVTLKPSLAKMASPAAGDFASSPYVHQSNTDNTTTPQIEYALPETISSSLLKLRAGKGIASGQATDDTLTISKNAILEVFPGGTVNLQGPWVVMDGATIKAPSGTVSIKSDLYDVTIKNGSRILASTYNKPGKAVSTGYPVTFTPMSGSSVTLEAKQDLIFENGAEIDISGSDPVTKYVKSLSGRPAEFLVAGDSGSLTLIYGGNLKDIEKIDIKATPKMHTVKGGTLAVKANASAISLAQDVIDRYLAAGFDDMTFSASGGLTFAGSVDAALHRHLTLDAPTITSTAASQVTLSAPWITLSNTFYPEQENSASTGQSKLLLIAKNGWIDVLGSVILSGFSEATLQAGRDMTLADGFYGTSYGPTALWKGYLGTAGDLVLQASRIYPTTLSLFTVRTPGNVTVKPGDYAGGTVYSAGGSLTIQAASIDQYGFLAAPFGEIVLANYDSSAKKQVPAQRITLYENSVTTVAGQGLVNYGTTDESYWNIVNKSSGTDTEVTHVQAAPEKAVTIKADNVSVMKKAEIDVSGGGELFAYLFQSSPSGTEDPLKKTGRYVIVPDSSVNLPGWRDSSGKLVESVYFDGGAGIAAGYYSLLPERYAFLPGALIVTDLGKAGQTYTVGQTASSEGYPVIAGYSAVLGTNIRSSSPKGYSVRKAEDVRSEGSFLMRESVMRESASGPDVVTGSAGRITIAGTSASIKGNLAMTAIEGAKGGVLDLSAETVIIGQIENAKALTVDPALIADMDLDEISFGNEEITNKVTVMDKVTLNARKVTLAANAFAMDDDGNSLSPEVIVKSGAGINAVAVDGTGEAAFLSEAGKITFESGSKIHASDRLTLSFSDICMLGGIKLDHSTIAFQGSKIMFVPEGYTKTEAGFYLTPSLWNTFKSYGNILLKSKSDVLFLQDYVGDSRLTASGTIAIDAARIASGHNADETGYEVEFVAPTITLLNTGGTSSGNTAASDTGSLAFKASQISVGHGDLAFDGFSQIDMTSSGDMTFLGKGSLSTGGSNLIIRAPRVTTSYYRTSTGAYETAHFKVDAGTSAVSLEPASGGTAGTSITAGGLLEILGRAIDISTLVQMRSGQLNLAASTGNVSLDNGARLDVQGSEYAPGGRVYLASAGGNINLEEGSIIDVSAGGQKDAGLVSLSAPNGGVMLKGGILKGAAWWNDTSQQYEGSGGSLIIDTVQASDLNHVSGSDLAPIDYLNSQVLMAGGFNDEVSLRIRAGDVHVSSTTDCGAPLKISANKFKLSADGGGVENSSTGNITVDGTIEASGNDAVVELYAWNDLNLNGTIKSRRSDGSGGDVYLNAGHVSSWSNYTANLMRGSGSGTLVIGADAVVDVSGAPAAANGGQVYLRAYRNGTATNMNLQGVVKGAWEVSAETVQAYKLRSTTSSNIGGYTDYEFTPSPIASSLRDTDNDPASVKTLAGIEVRSNDSKNADGSYINPNLTLNQDWIFGKWTTHDDPATGQSWWEPDAASLIRPGGQPGVLTLRATGNLSISSNLADYPDHPYNLLNGTAAKPTWAFNFVAGADSSSSDWMAVTNRTDGTGKLSVGGTSGNKLVYTEDAPIRFASGGDTEIKGGSASLAYATYIINQSLKYTVGSVTGSISGSVLGSLKLITNGTIETATGDIDLQVGKDLVLNATSGNGSVRTTGFGSWSVNEGKPVYRGFSDGGSIHLDVGGSITGKVYTGISAANNAWDIIDGNAVTGFRWYARYEGKPTEGIANMAGGDVFIRAGGDILAQIGTFGEGDFSVYSGGDINGRFLIKHSPDGRADISAMGSLGTTHLAATQSGEQAIEIFDCFVNVSAQGDIKLGSIVNPLLAYTEATKVEGDAPKTGKDYWDLRYGTVAGVKLTAVSGDVSLAGDSVFHDIGSDYQPRRERVLPATVEIYAGRDILLSNEFALAPSSTGNLILKAGRNINGLYYLDGEEMRSTIYVSDRLPSEIYGVHKNFDLDRFFSGLYHAQDLLHAGDDIPVEITAEQGDIRDLRISLPKKAEITAGQNIRDLYYFGQNLADTDVTLISAGGDIYYLTGKAYSSDSTFSAPIIHGGPGTLIVQAGNNIDLGTTSGIQTVGRGYYSSLPSTGSDLVVIAGGGNGLTKEEIIATMTPLFNPDYKLWREVDGKRVWRDVDEILWREVGEVIGCDGKLMIVRDSEGEETFDVSAVRNLDRFKVGDVVAFSYRQDKEGNRFASPIMVRSTELESPVVLKPSMMLNKDVSEVTPWLGELREAGEEWQRLYSSSLKSGISEGEKASLKDRAERVLNQVREDVISSLFSDTSSFPSEGGIKKGTISMTQSQISTRGDGSSIYVLNRGDLNVGKSAFATDAERQNTGIFTASGGSINILTGGNVNVNEARIMTFGGGDINMYALWGDNSAVNAGRGAQTAISVEAPKTHIEYDYTAPIRDEMGNVTGYRIKSITVEFKPPAVGSGIRTLTYDPDGAEGPLEAPPEGDVSICAKTIDAGEAGIHGNNVKVYGVTVLNSQNITFSGAALGVPVQSAGVSVGALTGSTNMNKDSVSEAGALGAGQGRDSQKGAQVIEDIVTKWLDVKVIDVDWSHGVVGGPEAGDDEDAARKKKKQ